MKLVLLVCLFRLIIGKDYLIESDDENEFLRRLEGLNISNLNISSIQIKDENKVSHIFSLKTDKNLSDFKLHDNKKYTNNNFLPNENNATKFNNLYEKYISTKYLYWNKGYTGKGVKIGIFDSGVNKKFNCNIIDIINFTEEEIEDQEGHGTFITSVYITY